MSFKVKAIYEYSSPHEDDLNFPVGQIITVTDEDDAEWYGGEYVDDAGTKHEGIFPRNFVEKYEPTAPPRPTRTRAKKEPEPEPEPEAPVVNAPTSPTLPPPAPAPVAEPEPKPEPVSAPAPPPTETTSSPPPLPVSIPEPVSPKPSQASQFTAPPPAPRAVEAPAPAQSAAPKSAPTQSKPSGPPPVAEKPSSFKDRIAAFNKAAAPPIAPFKPGGLGSGSTGFIKKPFVAPPPSRNAYIPPPQQAPTAKIYRRDEDPEVKEQEAEVLENAGKAGLIPAPQAEEAEDDQPKPMSLKERLALLQKQQQETAARHADALAKKDKPKRPPKKRTDTQDSARESETAPAPTAERADVEEAGKSSLDEAHPPRVPHQNRRKSSRGAEPNDGNEADMSGAGDTTEGQEELTEKEEGDDRNKHVATAGKQDNDDQNEEEDDEEEEEEEIDPEVRRREELRARMAKMSGGMGLPGMPGIPLFGAPPPILPKKKKPAPEKTIEEAEDLPSPRAPPVPTMMALPGMSRPQPDPQPQPQQQQQQQDESEEEEDESRLRTPHQETAPGLPSREPASPPPIPGGRPAPPPIPSESRPPPPLPPTSAIRSPSEGSESDDELSERPQEESDTPKHELTTSTRAPPPPPVAPPPASQAPPLPPVGSPRPTETRRDSYVDGASPVSPSSPQNRRASRLPPPIPGAAPAPPPPTQTRPPPPPPPGAAPPISRTSTADAHRPTTASRDEDDGEEEEITEYEGDYDTDIASSVPHKDALKAHQRESSFEDVVSPRSPTMPAPPPPPSMAPRAPPPVPAQSPPSTRKSTDMPRMAPPPPPPPPAKDNDDDEYDPYNYGSPPPLMPSYSLPTPPPHMRHSEDAYSPEIPQYSPPQNPRAPLPAPPPGLLGRSAPSRPSLDVQRGGPVRRSVDVTRPSMESGFVANDIDLANNSGWWLQPNTLPPQLQGRKDIYFESEESTAADPQRGGNMVVTRDIYVLYQDYSQTVITVRFDPQNILDVDLEQRHEAPPRALRQDQLEQSYERFGRAIGEAVPKLKDTVVGDGTPQALVYELLKPYKDSLHPVGTRAYGALVYSNLANASTSQNDEIRPGDIISIRNARFQGKHGAMHAKYSVEVGKPDHVAIVAEWDGTKKKVRAWEQGRESKKVKMESFKLDDLRSGEVKIWRVMPRSWIGWESLGN